MSNREKIVWMTIPLDEETSALLEDLSKVCQADKVAVAASLLHDLLRDDEAENIRTAAAVGSPTYN